MRIAQRKEIRTYIHTCKAKYKEVGVSEKKWSKDQQGELRRGMCRLDQQVHSSRQREELQVHHQQVHDDDRGIIIIIRRNAMSAAARRRTGFGDWRFSIELSIEIFVRV